MHLSAEDFKVQSRLKVGCADSIISSDFHDALSSIVVSLLSSPFGVAPNYVRLLDALVKISLQHAYFSSEPLLGFAKTIKLLFELSLWHDSRADREHGHAFSTDIFQY